MKAHLPTFNFCPLCGETVTLKEAEGRVRPVCDSCGNVIYINPIPAIALVVFDGQGRLLLTLRNIEPKKGHWCLPGGFLEWGESPEEGGARELQEETALVAKKMDLIGAFDSMNDNCRHVLVLAYTVLDFTGEAVAGDDAGDVGWFTLDDMPELAFRTHKEALRDALAKRDGND